MWAHRALSIQKRWFLATRGAACLIHYLLLQKVTSPRFTILNGGFRPGQVHSEAVLDRQAQAADLRVRRGRVAAAEVRPRVTAASLVPPHGDPYRPLEVTRCVRRHLGLFDRLLDLGTASPGRYCHLVPIAPERAQRYILS